ncbi:MAG: hypothetical protein ACXADB_06090 [Candidatus Hermodarchaeia archaeon]|jgi:hypothetical protein
MKGLSYPEMCRVELRAWEEAWNETGHQNQPCCCEECLASDDPDGEVGHDMDCHCEQCMTLREENIKRMFKELEQGTKTIEDFKK